MYGSASSRMTVPTTEGSPPNRFRHSPWLSTTKRFAPGAASSGRNPRPSAGTKPSSGSIDGVTAAAMSRTGSPRSVSVNARGDQAASWSMVVADRCHVSNVSLVMPAYRHPRTSPARYSRTRTSRSLSGQGSGRSSTPRTRLKSAALAPTDKASTTMAVRVSVGVRRSATRACLTSWRR